MPGALPFGAKYRLIDFTLSNCRNSGIRNVAIFPYGNYRSLADHIGSGDRWDLNRRRDGIFILPPKNLSLTIENAISFQRMYEHIEHFRRSTQSYVIVSPANIVWNVDYNVFLDHHQKAEADITEILGPKRKRLKTFIVSKDFLLAYVKKYNQISYRNLADVFDYAPGIKRNLYTYENMCYLIDEPKQYYRANRRLLEYDVRRQLFVKDRPILSKETMSAPARYGDDAYVINSVIASGAYIEGNVENSVIGRKVHVAKEAVVRDSVVMNQSVIEQGAAVSYAVLDKESHVTEHATVSGHSDELFIAEKRQIVTTGNHLNVLQITAECFPFVKTGGMADVVGSLAEQLSKIGVHSEVMMPLYPAIKEKYHLLLKERAMQKITYGDETYPVTLHVYDDKITNYYFLESYAFFDRDDKIYGYGDDGDRFAFFSKAAVAFLDAVDEMPDIIHIHDWHMGLVPLLLKRQDMNKNISTLLTIHNIEYQGIHESIIAERLQIADEIPVGGTMNFLELGINHADKISTVSETYRDELKYEYYSKNLMDAINRRDRDFYGILNGLSQDVDPKDDLDIQSPYDQKDVFEKKPLNKHDLQTRMNIKTGDDMFVIGMVTRIAEQKGFDIIIPALREFLSDEHTEFVLLGTGDDDYVRKLKTLEDLYPDRVALNIGYDATKPTYIYAGADVFLMPSRYEPCGIGQMIALRYGTIPIVRQTGGLNDTIEHFNVTTRRGNGFKFYNYDVESLRFQLENTKKIFDNHGDAWKQLISNAMRSRFSFETTTKAYHDLYNVIVAE